MYTEAPVRWCAAPAQKGGSLEQLSPPGRSQLLSLSLPGPAARPQQSPVAEPCSSHVQPGRWPAHQLPASSPCCSDSPFTNRALPGPLSRPCQPPGHRWSLRRGPDSGEAQEETSPLPTDSPAAITGPFLTTSADLGASSSVPGPPDGSSELPDNELVTDTGRPSPPASFTVVVPDLEDVDGSVTPAPGDAISSVSPVTPNPSSVAPVTRSSEATIMETTQPPPISAANNVTEDTATETSSLLATLRMTTTAKMAPSDDPTPSTAASTSFSSTWMSTITTSLFITTTVTSPDPSSTAAPSTPAPHTTRAEVQRGPSVLEVGDEKDLTSYHSRSSSNPLFVMIVSVFTIMVLMVVVVVGFHRYKKRNSRTEFRRLQDLPMDDMMEDTPLSLYSY